MSGTMQATEAVLNSKSLSALDELYDDTKAFSFDRVPDGDYDVRVEEMEMTRAKTGAKMLRWTFGITGPKFANRKLWKNTVFPEAPKNQEQAEQVKQRLSFIKRDLQALGYTGPISQLTSVLGQFLGKELRVSTKIDGESQHVYLREQDVTSAVEKAVEAEDVQG